MMFKVEDSGAPKKMQLDKFPQLALFQQRVEDDRVVVQYLTPEQPLIPDHPLQKTLLEVPLQPDLVGLLPMDIDLHHSPAKAYRMGDTYDSWFSACLGFRAILVYIGDGRRPVLGTLSPRTTQVPQQGWVSSVLAVVWGAQPAPEPDWLTFTDVAPFLVTSESSLQAASSLLPEGESMDMFKFRPNIVVDGEDAWEEDFWAELIVNGQHKLQLTANCGRCTSINVDYATGRQAAGEKGGMLKKLSKERRVDPGHKWSPIFGRYGFLGGDDELFWVSVGDDVQVSRRSTERTIFDWRF
jgi:uncharacterized protein YcbX